MPARPVVQNRYRREGVHLQPYGNTVSITTESDNPFEDSRNVEVYTQLSGGMAGPDAKQRSRKIHTKPNVHARVAGGRVPTMVVNEASHRGFIPGLGDDSSPSAAKSIADALKDATAAAAGVVSSNYAAKAAAANQKKAEADARAAQSSFNLSQMYSNMGQHKAISIPLVILGVGAAVTALVLFMRKRK